MNLHTSNLDQHGLTRLEVLVVIFSLFLIIALLLPAIGAAAQKRNSLACASRLGNISMAFKVWENDIGYKNPLAAAGGNSLTTPYLAQGSLETMFQAMSNQLTSPKILVCPADKGRKPAASFNSTLTPKNISYFFNMNSQQFNPQDILFGDDNLEIRGVRVKSGLLELTSNNPIAWHPVRHHLHGYVALADGSVQAVNNSGLTNYLYQSNPGTVHLAIP